MSKKMVGYWRYRGCWLCLYEDKGGYWYRGKNCGGNTGSVTLDAAMEAASVVALAMHPRMKLVGPDRIDNWEWEDAS